MPPKPRFTREEIVDAARPIFTVFRSMEELQQEVRSAAMRRFESCTMPGVPLFKQGGHADGSLRRAGAEVLSAALHARKPQRRQL